MHNMLLLLCRSRQPWPTRGRYQFFAARNKQDALARRREFRRHLRYLIHGMLYVLYQRMCFVVNEFMPEGPSIICCTPSDQSLRRALID